MCAIGRGLMSMPKYLLIDEMSLGVAPIIVDRLEKAMVEIKSGGDIGLLIVEQDVVLALELASYAYVVESGCVVREGPAEELAADPRIMEAYLGMSLPTTVD
jgi:branched-chain amino acid transport system ATP-binding protein